MNSTISLAELRSAINELQHMAIAFLILIVTAIMVRMYVRLHILKKFGMEDWAMIVTFFLASAYMGIVIFNCQLASELTHGHLSVSKAYIDTLRAAGVCYIGTLVALKISVGFFFLHILSLHRIQRIAIYVIMIGTIVLGVAYIPIGNFTCAQFKLYPGKSNCPTSIQDAASGLYVAFSLINIIGDFAFAIMACFAIWRAKIPTPTKVSAAFLLCLGCVGGAASTVRLGIFLSPVDVTKYSQELLVLDRWILIELGSGVIATNLVMTKPLFHSWLVKMGWIAVSGVGESTGRQTGNVSRTVATRVTRNIDDGDDLLLSEIRKDITVVVDAGEGPRTRVERGMQGDGRMFREAGEW